MRIRSRLATAAICALIAAMVALDAQQKIYWADEVPAGWNGTWPAELLTVPERTAYTRTTTSLQNLEFITALRGRSGQIHVVNMFISPLRKAAPAMVIANPRVTSAQEARASGKPVLFLFGNIHPPESEATEALLMLARDLTVGARKSLLQNQIVIIAPIFNVDGTDTFVAQNGSLVYAPGRSKMGDRQLMRIDRRGSAEPFLDALREFGSFRLSPDGHHVAAVIQGASTVSGCSTSRAVRPPG